MLLSIANQLYIVAELAVKNGVNTAKYRDMGAWNFISLGPTKSDQFIRLSSLSKYDKKAVGSINSIKRQIQLNKLFDKKASQNIRLRVIQKSLQDCLNNEWEEFACYYSKPDNTPKQIIMYSQEHALFHKFMFLINEKKFRQKEITQVLPLIGFVKFNTEQSLSRKLNAIKFFNQNKSLDESIRICITPKTKGVARPERRKVTEWHLLWIFYFYCKKNFSYPVILDKVNRICDRYGKHRIKLHHIKKELRSNYVKNLFGLKRYGYDWLKKHVLPYVDKSKPEGFLTILQIDGSRLQLPYYDHVKKKVDFLTIFVLLDASTSKIVGYWLDKYENRLQVLNAFFRFFKSYRYLPKLIVHDGSSAFRAEEFQFFKARAIELGVKFRKHLPINPNEKGQVERFFQVFCERICKEFPEYTGLSLVSKNPNAKPNKQRVMAILKNYKKLKSRHEITLTVDRLISAYNQLNINNQDSPNQREAKSTIDAIRLEKHQLALLTWRIKDNRPASRSEVKFYYQGTPYKYKIKKMSNILSLNGAKVNIAWSPSNLNHIFLYDSNFKYLETCFRKTLHADDVTRMSGEKLEIEFFKEVGKNKLVHKKIKEQAQSTIDEIEESFNEADYYLSLFDADKEKSVLIQNTITRQYFEVDSNQNNDIDDFNTEESSEQILAYIDNLDHENDY